MLSNNPFAILAETISPLVMQYFIFAMVFLIVVGTIIQMIHHKNLTYFFNNAKKAKLAATKELGVGQKTSIIAKTTVVFAMIDVFSPIPNSLVAANFAFFALSKKYVRFLWCIIWIIVPKAINKIIAIIKLCIAKGDTVSAKIENGFVPNINILPLC